MSVSFADKLHKECATKQYALVQKVLTPDCIERLCATLMSNAVVGNICLLDLFYRTKVTVRHEGVIFSCLADEERAALDLIAHYDVSGARILDNIFLPMLKKSVPGITIELYRTDYSCKIVVVWRPDVQSGADDNDQVNAE